jgi:hypothetical protein
MGLPRPIERLLAHLPQRKVPSVIDLRRREVGDRLVVVAMVVPVEGLRAPSAPLVVAHPSLRPCGSALERLELALAEGVLVARARPGVAPRDAKPGAELGQRLAGHVYPTARVGGEPGADARIHDDGESTGQRKVASLRLTMESSTLQQTVHSSRQVQDQTRGGTRAFFRDVSCVLGASLLPLALFRFGLDVTDSGWALVLSRDFFTDLEAVGNASGIYLTLFLGALAVKASGDFAGALRFAAFMPYAFSAAAAVIVIRSLPRATAWTSLAVVAAGIVGWSEFSLNWFNYNTSSACLCIWAFTLLYLGWIAQAEGRRTAATALLLMAGIGMGLAIASRVATGATVAGLAACIVVCGARRIRITITLAAGMVASVAVVVSVAAYLGHLPFLLEDLHDLIGSAARGSHQSHSGSTLARAYLLGLASSGMFGSVILILGLFAEREFAESRMCRRPFASMLAVLCIVGIGWTRRDYILLDLTTLLAVALILHSMSTQGSDRLVIVLALASWALFPLGSNNGFKNSCFTTWLLLPVCMSILASSPFGRIAKSALIVVMVCGIARAVLKPYRDQPLYALDTSIEAGPLGRVRTTRGRADVVADTAREIEARTQDGDRILVYQNSPMLYIISRTRPWVPYPWPMPHLANRVENSMHAREEADLPALIVRERHSPGNYDWPASSEAAQATPFKPDSFDSFSRLFERRHGFRVVHENDMYSILSRSP